MSNLEQKTPLSQGHCEETVRCGEHTIKSIDPADRGNLSMFINTICLIVPMLVGIKFDVAGGLFLTELLLPLIAIIYFVFRKKNNTHNIFKIIIGACIIYLLSLILSDIWNQTTYDQYSRGWARIAVFLMNFISLYILVNNHRIRLLLIATGIAIGRIWLSFDIIDIDSDGIPWKLGLAKPVTLLLIVLCVTLPFLKGPRNLIAPMLIISFGLVNIIFDYRSLGGVLVLSGALMGASVLSKLQNIRTRTTRATSIFVIIFVAVCVAALARSFYSYSADNDWLSERAQSKYESQTQQSDLPLLIAGRSELLVSLEAILDAPILGHGSWPEDPYYAEQLAARRYEYGLTGSSAVGESNLIPTHSHILGGWVEAGIAGAGFWAFILWLVGQALSLSLRGHSHMRALYIYSCILLIWDIFFSPFAGFRRLESAFLIVILLRSLLQRPMSGRSIAALKVRGKKPRRREKQIHA